MEERKSIRGKAKYLIYVAPFMVTMIIWLVGGRFSGAPLSFALTAMMVGAAQFVAVLVALCLKMRSKWLVYGATILAVPVRLWSACSNSEKVVRIHRIAVALGGELPKEMQVLEKKEDIWTKYMIEVRLIAEPASIRAILEGGVLYEGGRDW